MSAKKTEPKESAPTVRLTGVKLRPEQEKQVVEFCLLRGIDRADVLAAGAIGAVIQTEKLATKVVWK